MQVPNEFKDKIEEAEQKIDEAKELNKELGDGIQEGKVASFRVADGRAYYEVTQVGEKISKVNIREDMTFEGYRSEAVDSQGNILNGNLEGKFL